MASELFAAAADDVLYIVDLSGYVFRAYHAITPLNAPSGEPTQAVLGTVNMLERLVRQRRPAMLAVAMDSRQKTFRHERFPGYKANRPPQPEDLRHQLKRCRDVVDAFSIPVFSRDGLEADDLIAAAVEKARAHGLRVVIVSADKDLMQLVADDVLMWDTMRDRVFGRPEVEERFGVRTGQLRDLLALTGDTSDNIPGVPSVGPKTARDLLVAYGDLDGIYSHLDDIKRKALQKALRENKDNAYLSRDLVSLVTTVDLDFDPVKLRYGGRDIEALRRIYGELGFEKHLAALSEDASSEPASGGGASASSPREEAPPVIEVVGTRAELEAVMVAARARNEVAIVIEASHEEAMRADILGVGLCVDKERAYYVPIAHRYVGVPDQLTIAELREVLGPVLSDPAVKKVGHETKRLQVLGFCHGLPIRGIDFDTLLAGYVLEPNASHALEALAQAELGIELASYDSITHKSRGHQLAFDEVPVEDAARYSASRAHAIERLRAPLEGKIGDVALDRVFREIEMPLSPLLAEMEHRGVLVDSSVLEHLGKDVDAQLVELEKKAHQVAGRVFNIHSPRQLEALLFDELGLKPIKRTKTSRSTDAATLEALADRHPLPALILEIRQLAKLKGTYIDALPALVNPRTGRIHTRWAQAVAATGRLSSQDPNLQNIPIRSELGRSIRSAFVAPPDHELVSADYSQIELRVLAHLSEDPVLIEAFTEEQDIHLRTAMEVFGVDEKNVTAEHRRRAKAVNFGVIYGQGDSGLAKSLKIPRSEAASFIAAYFRRYEGVRAFMDATLAHARAGDSVRTLFGRRRMVPDIKSSNRARRLAAERVAMNTPIQGTAADLLKLAMLSLKSPGTPGSRMVLTVHDELVFEVPSTEVEAASREIRQCMESVYPLRVPLVVDVGHGKTWKEAH